MAYEVHFNDVNLSNYCTVLNVKRSVLPTRSNFSRQVPSMHGSYYTGGKYLEKVIPIEIAIFANTKDEYAQKVEALANVLNVREPAPLSISDEPYKNYYAIVDGSTDLEKVFHNGVATINFLCNDPFSESKYWHSFRDDGKGIFDVVSYGTTETHPIVDVDFKTAGCFVQLTNYEGKTVLVGKPKDSTKPVVKQSESVINDNCQDSTAFTTISDTLFDANRVITGTYDVQGSGIVCSNFGASQDGKWTGAGFKKNLRTDIADFEVIVDLTFSSQGENYVAPPPAPPPPPPKPEPVPPAMPKPDPPSPPPPVSLGTYKVVNCGGLYINKTPDVSQPLYAMGPGTLIYPTEIKDGWAKHTHSNRWNTFTGWSSMKYLQKVSNSGRSMQKASYRDVKAAFADEQLGLLEIYGYDRNGAKLFKFEISDTNSFYEFVEPKVIIGGSTVLKASSNVPAPRKVDGKEMASGVFGDFNDFSGQFSIRRERNSKGDMLWFAEIRKISNGKVVKTLTTPNSITSNSFSKASLSYIGVFIGRHGNSEPVSMMSVTNIRIRNLNLKTDQVVDDNLAIFEPGDHMQIDFKDGIVTLNDESYLTHLDIGSEFFTIPPGRSQFIFRSDADSNVVCGFKDKFI